MDKNPIISDISDKHTTSLRLNKVVGGRKKWRERSNTYQGERRKLQDKNRYLKQSLKQKGEQLSQANEEINKLKKTQEP